MPPWSEGGAPPCLWLTLDGGPRLKAVPPKSSVAAHPPGGDPGKDQHLDLWEVLSPWNPALLKTTYRGIDRIGSNELDRASLRGGARAPAPNGDVGRRQLRLERGRPPEARQPPGQPPDGDTTLVVGAPHTERRTPVAGRDSAGSTSVHQRSSTRSPRLA